MSKKDSSRGRSEKGEVMIFLVYKEQVASTDDKNYNSQTYK
ncbi:hypothetical protein [Bacillus sp. CGMCC 1.16541]|nr:hypothetical protein [Bacillus sp. CGMCC 1.16541]